MRSTGIVRKVDELGRVVIPKEIRKVAFIDEGTPLEIFSNEEGEIIFKKYSQLKNLEDFAVNTCDSINDIAKAKVAIFDKNEIIASSGVSKKNASIFFEEHSINKIHNYTETIIKINNSECYVEYIKADGNIVGEIIIYDVEKITESIISATKVMSLFLGRIMI